MDDFTPETLTPDPTLVPEPQIVTQRHVDEHGEIRETQIRILRRAGRPKTVPRA